MDRVNGTVMEHKPTDLERAALLLGRAAVQFGAGYRTAYGGRTWGWIKRAIEALGVKDDDLVSIEANIGDGGTGWYEVDDAPGGIKEVREVVR
jgi:hypothetical protein